MKPADDPSVDYRELVRRGYDTCSAAYTEARSRDSAAALDLLPLEPGSKVLDLGCGAGIPVARELAKSHRVTGVDFSEEQIGRARENVPGGHFFCADLLDVDLPGASFDAVVAFYVVFHLPREEHAELFRRIWAWLAPGGHLLATVTRWNEAPYTEENFFGVPMYWSNFSPAEYASILTEIGFEVVGAPGRSVSFDGRETAPLILARKR